MWLTAVTTGGASRQQADSVVQELMQARKLEADSAFGSVNLALSAKGLYGGSVGWPTNDCKRLHD